MSNEDEAERNAGLLQRVVEAAAISPADARKLVARYKRKYAKSNSQEDFRRVARAIVRRYARLAATSGVTTSLPSVIPGIGQVAALLGGGLADVAVSLKLQIDLCTCLAELYKSDLPDEDKVLLAMVVGLAGSAEQFASVAGIKSVEEIARRIVLMYLRGGLLQTIKGLFRKVGIIFTQKAAAKLIPFGIGVALAGGTNYALTRVVGEIAIRVFEELPDDLPSGEVAAGAAAK